MAPEDAVSFAEDSARPGHAPTRLRSGVELIDREGENVLVDHATGLSLVLGKDAARLVRDLPVATASNAGGQVLAFFEQLRELGLCEPTTVAEARRAQGRYVLEQAQERERERVQATVRRAVRTTRLHREHLGPDLGDAASFALEELPLLHKPDIRRRFPDGLTAADLDLPALLRARDLVLVSTSGTTGERLQTYSDTRIPRLPPDVVDFWRLERDPSGGPLRTVVLTSPSCSGHRCSSRLPFEERISFEHTLFLPSPPDPFVMTPGEVGRILDEMRRFEADIWLVNPVYLHLLADAASAHGFAFPPALAIVFTYQYFSHCQRRALARHFAAPVFSLYSATELAGSQIALGCPEGRQHVWLDQVFVEVLRAGLPVAPGELGSVTVTTHNPTLPLVRYALRDLARIGTAPCGCDVGSSWPVLELEGRERDAFVVGGTWITTKAVDDALRDVDLVVYQLSETTPRRYRLEGVAREGGDWRDAAREALEGLLEPDALSVVEVASIAMDASQKFRFTRPLP